MPNSPVSRTHLALCLPRPSRRCPALSLALVAAALARASRRSRVHPVTLRQQELPSCPHPRPLALFLARRRPTLAPAGIISPSNSPETRTATKITTSSCHWRSRTTTRTATSSDLSPSTGILLRLCLHRQRAGLCLRPFSCGKLATTLRKVPIRINLVLLLLRAGPI